MFRVVSFDLLFAVCQSLLTYNECAKNEEFGLKRLKITSWVLAALLSSTSVRAEPLTGIFDGLFSKPNHQVTRHQGQRVLASYYGGGPRRYEPNAHTASGELFDWRQSTCAHRTLPFGTRLRVSYGGRSIVCRVNDRGPAASTGRSLDMSKGDAMRLGTIRAGVALVDIEVLH